MTPREKRLREALSRAKYIFNEIECAVDKLADLGMEDMEKAKQETDLMQDGPSEEDKERLKEILDYAYISDNRESDLEWMADELKKYMGIK